MDVDFGQRVFYIRMLKLEGKECTTRDPGNLSLYTRPQRLQKPLMLLHGQGLMSSESRITSNLKSIPKLVNSNTNKQLLHPFPKCSELQDPQRFLSLLLNNQEHTPEGQLDGGCKWGNRESWGSICTCVEAYENGKQCWGHKDKGSETVGKSAHLDSRPQFHQCQG